MSQTKSFKVKANPLIRVASVSRARAGSLRITSLQGQSIRVPQPTMGKGGKPLSVNSIHVSQPKMSKGGSGNFQAQSLKIPQTSSKKPSKL